MTPIPTDRPNEYTTEGLKCPKCQRELLSTITLSGKPPGPGTITVCMKCGAAAIFLPDLSVTEVAPDMMAVIEREAPEIAQKVRLAQAEVRKHRAGMN